MHYLVHMCIPKQRNLYKTLLNRLVDKHIERCLTWYEILISIYPDEPPEDENIPGKKTLIILLEKINNY